MGVKLEKGVFPSGHGRDDFNCFGPPATEDGKFEGTLICDMGCFKQDGTDSNKYYHGAVVQSKKSGSWYVYFEWGRTGASSPSFQFVECSSKGDAEAEYADQLHSKNDKRGMWVMLAGEQRLQAKPGKDCYLVRPQATRSTGLPSAKTITLTEDIAKAQTKKGVVPATAATGKKAVAKKIDIDKPTIALMRDLNMAAVSYTRSAMADAALPTLDAITEARDLLTAARKCLLRTGDNVAVQIADDELKQMTYQLYGRIPKKKALGAAPAEWILSQNNILMWDQDLDAFESALAAQDLGEQVDEDPFSGMPLRMSYIDPKGEVGQWIYKWAPGATRNVHGYLGDMRVKNAWVVDRFKDTARLGTCQDKILAQRPQITERPLHQPKERPDLSKDDFLKYVRTNTSLLFHGTRSVNVGGILREGLRLPKQLVGVVITGAMFGPGQYYADDWKKSAGYCSLSNSYWSRGSGEVKGRHAFMFLVDVVLGKPFVAPGPRGYTSPPNNCHCVFGKAGASQVQNNEWIVFDIAQHQLKYLIEFTAS